MKKEEKLVIIDRLAEQLKETPHFYLTDISTLNAEKTTGLRRKCFEKQVKLVVVKNTLLRKALEKIGFAEADIFSVLTGSTSVMFADEARNFAPPATSPCSKPPTCRNRSTWATACSMSW